LGCVLALSAWALTSAPVQISRTVPAEMQPASTAPAPEAPLPEQGAPPTAALPAALPTLTLESAAFDPFVGVPLTPPQSIAPPVVMVAAEPPPVQPQAPAVNYRFAGRVVSPTGEAITLLLKDEQLLAVHPGQRLDEGYVVEAIDERAVHLHFAPLNSRLSIPIPGIDAEPAAPRTDLR
jgi:hypothetical protein